MIFMNKKRVLPVFFIFLLVLVLISVVAADTNRTAEESYTCLKTKLGDNCGTLTNPEEISFSLLAMAYDSGIQSDCKSKLLDKEKSNCWGDDDCDIKSTALAIIALNNINENVDNEIKWLLNDDRKKVAKGLEWYLQIDTNSEFEMDCTINSKDVKIGADRRIKSISSSTCLTKDSTGYYLKISPTCYDDNFTISCDQDFISNTFYKARGIYYVSDRISTASAGGKTNEKVNGYCFSTSANCNYEASLWATLALAKAGKPISEFLAYLYSEGDKSENQKYFPAAFLYMLSDEDEYATDVKNSIKQRRWWQQSNSNDKYYDSSLALLSLYNLDMDEITNSKEYFLNQQADEGCWADSIKKTAFLLYAGWQKPAAVLSGTIQNCETAGNHCVAAASCTSANIRTGYTCLGADICCSTNVPQQTCAEKTGSICTVGQTCSGGQMVVASGTSLCCVGGICTSAAVIQNECQLNAGTCSASCSSSQEEKQFSCGASSALKCCTVKQVKSKTGIIILLIILIILVILAIIFRHQLQIWAFRIKSRFSSGKAQGSSKRPPSPPSSYPSLNRPRMPVFSSMPARFPTRQSPARQSPSVLSKTGKKISGEFDDVMKKLREIGK